MDIFDIKRIIEAIEFIKPGEIWAIKSGDFDLQIGKHNRLHDLVFTISCDGARDYDRFFVAYELLYTLDLEYMIDHRLREYSKSCELPRMNLRGWMEK